MGKIQRLKIGIDGEIRSAEILLPSHTVISRAINFLYPLELPTLQDERQQEFEHNSYYEDDIRKQTRVATDDTMHLDEKKRKASVVAQKRIYDCLKDNGTPVLFCLSPGRLS